MSDKKSCLSSRLRNCFQLIVVLAATLTASPVMAQDTPTLSWEMVNPFALYMTGSRLTS